HHRIPSLAEEGCIPTVTVPKPVMRSNDLAIRAAMCVCSPLKAAIFCPYPPILYHNGLKYPTHFTPCSACLDSKALVAVSTVLPRNVLMPLFRGLKKSSKAKQNC